MDDLAERAEARADRLQLKLDEERALCNALRKQLRESSASAQKVSQQMRALQGAPNAPDAPGGSIAGLQLTVTRLRDRLDVEKKAANAAQADKHRLEEQLASGAREKQKLTAAQAELRAELKRTSTELERARVELRETGNSHEEAVGQVSSLTMTRGRERVQMEKEIMELKQQLELEKRRATNRATRAAAAEAALRRKRGDGASTASTSSYSLGGGSSTISGGGGGSGAAESVCGSICGSARGGGGGGDAPSEAGSDLDAVFGFGGGAGRALDFDLPPSSYAGRPGSVPAPPSASVSAMACALEAEKKHRRDAEAALASAVSEHAIETSDLQTRLDKATAEADELNAKLERKELEAGGAPARSALRALERQLSDAREKAAGAEARERSVRAQLHSFVAAVRTLIEGGGGGGGGGGNGGPSGALQHAAMQEQLARETIRQLRTSPTIPSSSSSSSFSPSFSSNDAASSPVASVSAAMDVDKSGMAAVEAKVEVERCLALLEARLRAVDAAAAVPNGVAIALEKKAAALAELSGAAAQSPTRGKQQQQQQQQRPGSAFGSSKRGTNAASAAAASTSTRKVLHDFEDRIVKAAVEEENRREGRDAKAFETRLAAARGSTGGKPTTAHDSEPSSPISSPQPLTRDQIKARYLEKMTEHPGARAASAEPAARASTSTSTTPAIVTTTAIQRPSAMTRAGAAVVIGGGKGGMMGTMARAGRGRGGGARSILAK